MKQKYRNQKIGTKLIKITEDELRNAGIRIITVQTATWNEDGIRFYKKLGYNECGVFPAYFGKNNNLIWFDKYLI
ncbi:MAG: GNAT family N-acetyltransferase [Candidatus Marinimicrobia bacterium]|nr:GNAT family N-acetyltransferase [Candidatus Neomarinimicrobiota bacterium]